MATVPRPTVKPLPGWQHAVPKGTVASQLGFAEHAGSTCQVPPFFTRICNPQPQVDMSLVWTLPSGEVGRIAQGHAISEWLSWGSHKARLLPSPMPFPSWCWVRSDSEKASASQQGCLSSSPRPLPFFHLFPFPCRAQLSPFPHSPSLPPLEHFVACSLGRALLQDPALEMFTVSDEQQVCTLTVHRFASCFHIEAT